MATSVRSATNSRQLSTLPRKLWHKSAPVAVGRAFRWGKKSKGWAAWIKHLAQRTSPVALTELLPGKQSPLTWALPEEAENRGTAVLLGQIEQFCSEHPPAEPSPENALLEWLADVAGSPADTCYALESLAWCHALPKLAAAVPADAWWLLVDHLLGAVADAEQICLNDYPHVHQLLAGELALTMAYLFPEITRCRKLAAEARRALSAGLVELTDGQGLPHAKYLGLLRPLLACWTRCRALGNNLSKRCWNGAAQIQYEWLVRHALRLTRYDGSHVLSRRSSGAWCKELFDAALHLGGNDEDEQVAALALPGRKKANKSRIVRQSLPEAAYHSQWAATSVLRTGWSRPDPQLVATYFDETFQVELGCGRDVLWSGTWAWEVCQEGEPVQPTSTWEKTCWVSDDDADYLESEISLSGGLRLQRHMLLARADYFLFVADAVLGNRPAGLEYRSCLPLRKPVKLHPAKETWEGLIRGRWGAVRVLPLALPEWRAGTRVGSLSQTERGLELCQSIRGSSMFAPLFFDLKPRRMTRPLTWRQLTVAENRQIQPPDVAVGYRVMIGKEQWLIYRSLREVGNRTLLGHNLSTEFLVARFDHKGEVEPLLEIE